MDDDICIGILHIDDQLEVATRRPGAEARTRLFLANATGIHALTQFVAGFHRPVRAAVAGAAAITIGLALSAVPDSEVYVVSPVVAAKSVNLARYAERAI